MSDRVINIRSKGGGKIKKGARHRGWTPLGIFKARPRECICKFIRLCWPIGICLRPAHATAVGPMGEKGSRGLPAIDRRTWVLVCASTRLASQSPPTFFFLPYPNTNSYYFSQPPS
ncbi:hypothetical protein CDAR_310101 [Caerostris darwini]|uniref:Uncharacterized protein n=1 Tax=Caerostris darwini TaxID=1538125 RepID=A0AAV4WSC6_9ARAC|nr:hypothetical protein CDAR_310101 [Caerostris darwini]